MKKTGLLIMLIVTMNFQLVAQDFVVSGDTVEISICGDLGPWIAHQDKFYCFFKTNNFHYSTADNELLYVFNREGNLLKQVDVPNEIKTYYDLFVQNNQIYIWDYYDHKTFYLDKNKLEFVPTKRADDLMYEDENYYIASIDWGEWGGTTWFRNKKTGTEYELGVSTPIVNCLNNHYYLSTSRAVYKIEDPENLTPCKRSRRYEKIFRKDGFLGENYNMQGAKPIYEDTIFDWRNKNIIATSALINGQLFHLFTDSSTTYLAEIIDGKMKAVYNFEKGFMPYRWGEQNRSRILGNEYQSIQFRTNDKHLYGIMEFLGYSIKLTYFKNTFRQPVLGTEKSRELFAKQFDFYTEALKTELPLAKVDSIESFLESNNLTDSDCSRAYLKTQNLECPWLFQAIEDSTLLMFSSFYFQTGKNSVEKLDFEWRENNLDKDIISIMLMEDDPAKPSFEEKWRWLVEIISRKYGSPNTQNAEEKFETMEWKNDGITVKLSFDYSWQIRLTISQDR